MDPLTQIALTRELIDIDSTTGREGDAGAFLAATLRGLGYDVDRAAGRGRSLQRHRDARRSPPSSSRRTSTACRRSFRAASERGRLYGRGACDAKGTLVAQIAAAERLRAAGEPRVGLLFVVGEERGSEGAKAANAIAAGSSFLINGEPTDNRLGTATRGVYRVEADGVGPRRALEPAGARRVGDREADRRARRAAPRSTGRRIRRSGRTFYTVGLIGGGVAPNVIPAVGRGRGDVPHGRRLRGAARAARRARRRRSSQVEDVLVVPPVRLKTVPGFDAAVFAFTTDIPLLDRWGAPLLLGPGSVTVAHTDRRARRDCRAASGRRSVRRRLARSFDVAYADSGRSAARPVHADGHERLTTVSGRLSMSRDRAADGLFVYAVTSTGVYCRPSCPSRRPRRDRVEFFPASAMAEARGYRAVPPVPSRGQDDGDRRRRIECVARAKRWRAGPTRAGRARRSRAPAARASSQLQRAFRRVLGLSPRDYVAACRQRRFLDAAAQRPSRDRRGLRVRLRIVEPRLRRRSACRA